MIDAAIARTAIPRGIFSDEDSHPQISGKLPGKGIMSPNRQIALISSAIAACLGCAGPLSAQVASMAPYDMPNKTIDQNGVDLAAGKLHIEFDTVKFGDDIRLKAFYRGTFPYFGSYPTVYDGPTEPIDFIGWPMNGSNFFLLDSNALVDVVQLQTPLGNAIFANGLSLETSTMDGKYFRNPAGGEFLTPVYDGPYTNNSRHFIGIYDADGDRYSGIISSDATSETSLLTFADGETWTIVHQVSGTNVRLRRVVSSRGYMIQYSYLNDAQSPAGSGSAPWSTVTKISGGSLAFNYCDMSSIDTCPALAASGNSVSISSTATGEEFDWSNGEKKAFNLTSDRFDITSPGSNSSLSAWMVTLPNYECGRDSSVVSKVMVNSNTWTYDISCAVEDERGDLTSEDIRTDPLGNHTETWSESTSSSVGQFRDELNHDTLQPTDVFDGIYETDYDYPNGDAIQYNRNARNDITSMARHAKGSSTWVPVKTFTYDAACSNLITCNKPNTIADANNNVTTLTYDPVHGGLLKETGPAVNGVTPETRYEYAQRYAWVLNSIGGYTRASTPIWVLVKKRYCRTTNPSGSTCAGGTADEVVTDYDYGLDSGPNNLLVRGVAVTADGQTRRTCFGYDQMGRKISETKPEAGLAVCP